MSNIQSSKQNRLPGLKRSLFPETVVRRARYCLVLFALTCVAAGSASADPAADCSIGRPTERSAFDSPPGAVGGPSWTRWLGSGSAALDPGRISILSWNIKKGSESGWDTDLHRLSAGKDLVLLQEAQLLPSFYGALEESMHRSGARGWKSSGVLTASRARRMNRCSYQHVEPLLGTPKASLLTEYPLIGTDDTLLVVNVHVVNFALGLSEFRQQIGDLHDVMARHAGPIILSGDFNTWRSSRLAILKEYTAVIGLSPVLFAEDNRIRKFGQALDHLFVRGLRPVSSRVETVDSSDHNPLIAVFGAVDSFAAIDATEPMVGGEI